MSEVIGNFVLQPVSVVIPIDFTLSEVYPAICTRLVLLQFSFYSKMRHTVNVSLIMHITGGLYLITFLRLVYQPPYHLHIVKLCVEIADWRTNGDDKVIGQQIAMIRLINKPGDKFHACISGRLLSINLIMKRSFQQWMNGVSSHNSALVRLYWAGDNLG